MTQTHTREKKNTDAASFDDIARNIFAPIYPVIADQMLQWTGLREGLCLDLGAGTGRLGFALAEKAPGFSVVLYDKSEEMLELARKDNPDPARIRTVQGFAEKLPFDEGSVDLAVSRGSVFFWDDQLSGFNEIYRVLRPGGWACIGGGFGNAALMKEIEETMARKNPEWLETRKRRTGCSQKERFETLLEKSAVPRYEVAKEEAGLWIRFQK